MVLWILAAGIPAGADEEACLNAVPFTDVAIADTFWTPRIETNRTATIPYNFKNCEETNRIRNFEIAGRLAQGKHEGMYFNDSDVYKVIEGASYSLHVHPDGELEKYLDGLIAKIAAAQEPDGYLYTERTIDPQKVSPDCGDSRWTKLISSHELYCVGHLYEAAAAHYQATGKRAFLDVAIKNADLIDRLFGPGKLYLVPGHEEIEIGLVKLYRATGDERYLKLANFFLEERGRPHGRKLYGEVYQDHKPIVEQDEIVGHAVRAMYLYAGTADVARITGNQEYLKAMDRLWQDMISSKLYLTGGIGAKSEAERFGDRYFLPNDTAYAETCAAIGLALWAHRMNLLHRDANYFDILERTLYNGLLSGVSLDGKSFFYVNPLESDGIAKFNIGSNAREPWFGCSCCPTNIARFLPSLGGYVYATDGRDSIYVNLYAAGIGRIKLQNAEIRIQQQTRYPWDGRVVLTIQSPDTERNVIFLRIPGWARNQVVPGDLYQFADNPEAKGNQPSLSVNGKSVENWGVEKGYARLADVKNGDVIELNLPMPVRRVAGHKKIEADAGKVALQRGPIVYCLEQCDNAASLGALSLTANSEFRAEFHSDLLGGITVVYGKAATVAGNSDSEVKINEFTAVPYYSWSNRGVDAMKVWLPTRL
jgi:uncharacterized protein